ncbi:hypothetical protein BH09ACT1_BH09ACT1_12140 [soil metagenome]
MSDRTHDHHRIARDDDSQSWWQVEHGGAPRWFIAVSSVVVLGGAYLATFGPAAWLSL